MEIQSILTNLFRDQRINEYTSRLGTDADDIKQDAFVVLLSKDPLLIAALHDRGELVFYTIKIIKNLSRTSKRKLQPIQLPDIIDEPEEQPPDFMDYIDNLPVLKNGFPYFKEIFKIVAKHGGQREASRATGIPRQSIDRDMNFIKQYLRDRV